MLIIAASVGVTVAYFSDYEAAMGEATLHLAGRTTIDEGDDLQKKEIVINNTGETDVVVRVAIFGPDQKTVTLPKNGKWEAHGDFYYYKEVLGTTEPNNTTGEAILAELTFKGTEEEIAAQKALLGDSVDITVVHESAPVVYNSEGKVQKPDGWDYIPAITE